MRDEFLKSRLAPASHSSTGLGCSEGTRRTILEEIHNWLESPVGPNIFWISGAPGSGKSAVVTSVIERLKKDRGELDVSDASDGVGCAKFFIQRTNEQLRDPRTIWRTIAFQLANLYRGIRTDILELLSKNSYKDDLQSVDVKKQFTDFIKGPLEKLSKTALSNIPVVVIDALDECNRSQTGRWSREHEDWKQFMDTLVEWTRLSSRCKLIITSRRDTEISDRLRHIVSRKCIFTVLRTGNEATPDSECIRDVRLFLKRQLEDIKLETRIRDPSWPQECDLNDLTSYAAGLFVWATLVIEFVGQKGGEPIDRLRMLMKHLRNRCAQSLVAEDLDVGQLYRRILLETLRGLNEKERDITTLVLASLVWLKAPLSCEELVKFLAPPTIYHKGHRPTTTRDSLAGHVWKAIENLAPVTIIRDNDGCLQVCHRSFLDFLEFRAVKLSQEAPSGTYESDLIFPDRSQQCARFVQSCLGLMNASLKFNICDIQTSHRPNDLCSELSHTTMPKSIPSSLAYACRYWIDHFLDIRDLGSVYANIRTYLRPFLEEHILEWIEVLSLTKSIRDVASKLRKAAENDVIERADNDLYVLMRDTSNFISTFEPAITVSAPHIYVSALSFAPGRSKILEHYGPRYNNVLSLISGRMVDWNTCVDAGSSESMPNNVALDIRITSNIGGDDIVESLAYDRGGQWIIAGSRRGQVRVWEARSGKCIAICQASHDAISFVDTVPGSGHIIAISNGIANRVHLKTGTLTAESLTPYYETKVKSVLNRYRREEFCRRSFDHFLDPHHNASDGIHALALSPDGCTVAFASREDGGAIRLWTVGKPLDAELDDTVKCVAFSPNGRIIVSSSEEGLQLWRFEGESCVPVRIGLPLRASSCHDSVTVVAFSPDGKSIATTSSGNVVRVWDIVYQDGVPSALNGEKDVNALASVIPISFKVSGDGNPKRVDFKVAPEQTQFAFRDGNETPAIGDWSYVDEDGWVRNGNELQFWLPPANRSGFWWPRNSAVIADNVTRVDFSRFMHGRDWKLCRTDASRDVNPDSGQPVGDRRIVMERHFNSISVHVPYKN
ncbi:YVTN repeat-like/Quino protein amine dehydrogenase [Schizopora paradoxa]|uniref:YVTN repeat-like/Quino protein amine dehydrogenase n=1 Tax=Schizopora paradoxa TaxID=27342 RepID=A0A0H2RET8_9AGAM|nr:YVTN repeat-like/Quino protein amine dehydrogenase [Schizopora paradoxa]